MMRFLMLIALLLCSSCIQIGGETPDRQYYLLRALTETPQVNSSKVLAIELKLTNFPEYLSRKELVTHIQTNGVKVAHDANWAEPLPDNLLRILRQNLSTLLPLAQISLSPWESTSPEALKAELIVNNFSGQLGGETNVDIRWLIRKDNQMIDQGQFIERQQLGQSYSDLADGLSQGVDHFSRVLAEKLTELQ